MYASSSVNRVLNSPPRKSSTSDRWRGTNGTCGDGGAKREIFIFYFQNLLNRKVSKINLFSGRFESKS